MRLTSNAGGCGLPFAIGEKVLGSVDDGKACQTQSLAHCCRACATVRRSLHVCFLHAAFSLNSCPLGGGGGRFDTQEMVLGVVGTFKDHRSLALTLQDSDHIARKLGLLIMTLILFILVVSEISPPPPLIPSTHHYVTLRRRDNFYPS